ncbi:MAG: TIGR01620 family protein [Magnetococcus sp. DMHC-6]
MNQKSWQAPVELVVTKRDKSASLPAVAPIGPIILPVTTQKSVSSPASVAISRRAEEEELPPLPKMQNKPSAWKWLMVSASLLALLGMSSEMIVFIRERLEANLLQGGIFVLFFAILVFSLFFLIFQEMVRLRRFGKLNILRLEAEHLVRAQTFGQINGFIKNFSTFYRTMPDTELYFKNYHEGIDDYLNDRERLVFLAKHVLHPIDRQAYAIIVQNAGATAILTATSSLAWLDALLFLWRNLRMIRQIASCYGWGPGFSGTIVLSRQVMRGLVMAGVTDLATDQGAFLLGESLTSAVLARAGQGIANGLYTARIGLQTMRLCRPIPFFDEEAPKLSYIRKDILIALKDLLRPPKKDKTEVIE